MSSRGKKHTEASLKKKTVKELRELCIKLGLGPCYRKSKAVLIQKILDGKKAPDASAKKAPVKARKKATIKVEENLEKMTVAALKALVLREKIDVPLVGSGKNGRLLKKDLVMAIVDHRARSSGKKEIKVPKPEKLTKSTLTKMKVSDLRKRCREMGIVDCKTVKYIGKATLIDLILAGKKADVKPKPAPKPKVVTPEKKASFKCGTKDKRKCPAPKICDVHSGKCVSRTKKRGLTKRAEDSRRKIYGDDYYFDEDLGLVGRKEDVLEHIKYWGLDTPSKPKPAPKPRTSKKCTAKKDPLMCDSGELCDADTGKCIEDTPSVRKQWILEVNGRTIVGKKAAIERLQKVLGGEVSSPSKKVKPAKPSDELKEIQSLNRRYNDLKDSDKMKPNESTQLHGWLLDLELAYEQDEPEEYNRLLALTKNSITKYSRRKAKAQKPSPKKPARKIPKTERGIQNRLDRLINDDDSDTDEIKELQKRLEELKEKKVKPSPGPPEGKKPKRTTPPKPPSINLTKQRDDIATTFAKCLASLE